MSSIGERLCEAWGLPKDRVGHISIEVEPHEVTVFVRLYVHDGEGWASIIDSGYRLVPVDPLPLA